MQVTSSGIFISLKLIHSRKADCPMLVTPSGMTVFWHPKISVLLFVSINALQFSRLSYAVFPASTFIVSRPLHSPNARYPISTTPFGIINSFKLLQPLNALPCISVTSSGRLISFKLLQFSNAQAWIHLTPSGRLMLINPLQPENT